MFDVRDVIETPELLFSLNNEMFNAREVEASRIINHPYNLIFKEPVFKIIEITNSYCVERSRPLRVEQKFSLEM